MAYATKLQDKLGGKFQSRHEAPKKPSY
jgi:hypothetical protein